MDKHVFEIAAECGDLEFMKWLYKNEFPFSEYAFNYATRHGNIDNMKWLHEKECPFTDTTFMWAAKHADLDIMEWLYEKKCPWGRLERHQVEVLLSKKMDAKHGCRANQYIIFKRKKGKK